MGIEHILSVIADVFGIVDFIFNVIILSVFKTRQSQELGMIEECNQLSDEFAALLLNINEDGQTNDFIRDKLDYYLCACKDYWLVFGFAGNYHLRYCLHLLNHSKLCDNKSKICYHIIPIIRILEKEKRKQKNGSTRSGISNY